MDLPGFLLINLIFIIFNQISFGAKTLYVRTIRTYQVLALYAPGKSIFAYISVSNNRTYTEMCSFIFSLENHTKKLF